MEMVSFQFCRFCLTGTWSLFLQPSTVLNAAVSFSTQTIGRDEVATNSRQCGDSWVLS